MGIKIVCCLLMALALFGWICDVLFHYFVVVLVNPFGVIRVDPKKAYLISFHNIMNWVLE